MGSPLRTRLLKSLDTGKAWVSSINRGLITEMVGVSRDVSRKVLFEFYFIFFVFYFYFFYLYVYFYYYYFLFVVNFVIHWNETAMGLHVFPIPIPPPTSLSTRSR